MYRFFVKETTSRLDAEIDAVVDELKKIGPNSEEYPKMITLLERLQALKDKERPERVSRDTLAIVLGNLAGVLAILSYEHVHVITSKALSQLHRPK